LLLILSAFLELFLYICIFAYQAGLDVKAIAKRVYSFVAKVATTVAKVATTVAKVATTVATLCRQRDVQYIEDASLQVCSFWKYFISIIE
jgi:hypothetical protein